MPRTPSAPGAPASVSRDPSPAPRADASGSAAASAGPMRTHPLAVRAAHWTSALLIVGALSIVWLREALEGDAVRATLLGVHRQLGLLVLLFWGLRLVLRLLLPRAEPETAGPAWQRAVAALVHVAIYGLLLSLPVLGWALTNAHGHDVVALGLWRLPTLVAVDPDLADDLQSWHETAAWSLLALVALHAGAALWHHWRARDGVLRAMWPGLTRPSRLSRPSHASRASNS